MLEDIITTEDQIVAAESILAITYVADVIVRSTDHVVDLFLNRLEKISG